MDTLQKQNFSAELMWNPTNASNRKLAKFGSMISKKYNIKYDSYWDLHEWSTKYISEFWCEIWDYLGIIYSKPYDEVVIENRENWELTKWFPGARLNFAENLLRYKDDHIAMILAGEDRSDKKITYSQLFNEVSKYAAALKKHGLRKGDRVACYMSNREEAIYAMLGTVTLGGIWVGSLPFFGSKTTIVRFQPMSPKFLFTIDRHKYCGEEKKLLGSLIEISKAISSLEKVIIVPSKDSSLETDISGIRNSCFLDEFLSETEVITPKLEFEQVEFDFPVIISFTSGTTGIPKALVHGCGPLLSNAPNFILHGNGSRDEVYLSASPSGWATWIMFLTTLFQGSSIVLYEGSPVHSGSSLWDIIDKYQITQIMVTGSAIDEMEKKNNIPSDEHSLDSLKLVIASACAVKPQAFDFFYKKIKCKPVFGSFYGTTESNGCAMVTDYTLPIYKGEMSAPSLGFAICCFNQTGESVEGERGELVFLRPAPGLPVGFWDDNNNSRFREAYLKKYPGVFCINDMCIINPVTKGTIIIGRSDETLTSSGTRFGSSEIYIVAEGFPEIADSLCVMQHSKVYDSRIVLFVKLSSGYQLTQDLVHRIQNSIKNELSKRHVPDIILEIKEIPYNMNGKKMESIVRKIINKLPYNSDTVLNPECLKLYEDVPELKDF